MIPHPTTKKKKVEKHCECVLAFLLLITIKNEEGEVRHVYAVAGYS